MSRGASSSGDPRTPGSANGPLSAAALRERFDSAPCLTVGIEEEVMVLDPNTLELAPRAPALLKRLDPDARFKLELPASQLEIISPIALAAADLAEPLLAARTRAAAAAEGLGVLAAAAVHPFSSPAGELNQFERYGHTLEEYGPVARRQLVCALHVHVAVGSADETLPVYNAARSYLPLIAGLAANGPIYAGADTGLASVRPKLCELLPRQGVPPALGSWEELAAAYRWGAAAGTFVEPRTWWWELRPHPGYGTLEFRVPDAQSTVGDAVAIAALVQELVRWLAERARAGEPLAVAPTWRIEENRWAACRRGTDAVLADLATGRRQRLTEVLDELLDELEPDLGGTARGVDWRPLRALLARGGGAGEQRARHAVAGPLGVAEALTRCFLAPVSG